jgi:hypothetical protein
MAGLSRHESTRFGPFLAPAVVRTFYRSSRIRSAGSARSGRGRVQGRKAIRRGTVSPPPTACSRLAPRDWRRPARPARVASFSLPAARVGGRCRSRRTRTALLTPTAPPLRTAAEVAGNANLIITVSRSEVEGRQRPDQDPWGMGPAWTRVERREVAESCEQQRWPRPRRRPPPRPPADAELRAESRGALPTPRTRPHPQRTPTPLGPPPRCVTRPTYVPPHQATSVWTQPRPRGRRGRRHQRRSGPFGAIEPRPHGPDRSRHESS